jgi:polyribonucleotide nucleotidyltransferase
MANRMVKKFQAQDFGYEVEIGLVAKQANGAVWFKHGGTVVLATAVAEPTKEFPGFLPLTVEYREQFSAAGKIPGGYYKREGKPTDKEVLTGRIIDRSIRPLFPANFFQQVQVVNTVYSVDKEHVPGPIALIASSLALTISNIPFLEPIAAVEMGRIDGKWVVNPIYPDIQKADAKLTIAGTVEGICMVEGSSAGMNEKEFVDVMFQAHEYIKKIVAWQLQIQKEVGKPKDDPAKDYDFDWALWKQRINAIMTPAALKSFFIEDKVARNERVEETRDVLKKQFEAEIEETGVSDSMIDYVFDSELRDKIVDMIFDVNKRIDGRDFATVRPISVEVGLLPFTHGSALFTRGKTQALVSATLGSGQDEQRIEELMDDGEFAGSFMLHYNFLPFSTGEIKPMRGPGRREIGHGYLAASAIRNMLPSKEVFPYTIRVVSDIVESDGSSSMATTCGAIMALMHAGVPIKAMVSGIAMGLLMNQKGEFKILSDICGFEDAFGLMDFKVAGTEHGITAIQMDIKYKGGLTRAVFDAALEQARAGRMHIMSEMRKVMSAPSPTLSDLVPKVSTLKIDTDKIGAIIGTGGKTIREISEKTKTEISIEPDGLVKIYGVPGADIDMAVNWINTLAGKIEKGMVYQGKIRRFAEFGIFVELVPGQDGLVHVSNVPRQYQRNFATHYKLDDIVTVEVVEYDSVSGKIRLRLIEK